jgi:hypothetical protein
MSLPLVLSVTLFSSSLVDARCVLVIATVGTVFKGQNLWLALQEISTAYAVKYERYNHEGGTR